MDKREELLKTLTLAITSKMHRNSRLDSLCSDCYQIAEIAFAVIIPACQGAVKPPPPSDAATPDHMADARYQAGRSDAADALSALLPGPAPMAADQPKIDTLGDALPREMARVRDKVLPVYLTIPTGILAATLMRRDIDAAAKAMAEGDLPAMIAAYKELKGWEL